MSLPDGWQLVSLDDVAETALGKMLDRGRSGGHNEVRYLRNVNVQWDRIDTHDLLTMELGEHERSRFEVLAGDLLVCEGGEIGRCAIWPGDGSYIAYQKALHRVRSKGAVMPKYVRYLLEHYDNNGTLQRFSTGSTIAHLPQQQLRRLPVPLPPLEEQGRIIEILEDHLSRLDAASGYLTTVIKRADAMRAGVFQLAVEGRLATAGSPPVSYAEHLGLRRALRPEGMKRGRPDPLAMADVGTPWPDRWTSLSLEEATHPVRTISYGILKPGSNMATGVPYVRVLNMRGDRLALTDLHRTSPEIAAQYERASLIADDVLVSIRGTYGRVVCVPQELSGGNITQDTARIAFIGDVVPEFAVAYLRSPWAQRYLKRIARGVAVKGVNIGDLRRMPFPLPSIDEQHAIISRLETLVSEVNHAQSSAKQAMIRGALLRKTLLEAAFSGKLTGHPSHLGRVDEFATAGGAVNA